MKTTLKDLATMMEFCRTIAFREGFGLSIVPANKFIIVKHIKERNGPEIIADSAADTFKLAAEELECTEVELKDWINAHSYNDCELVEANDAAGGVVIYADVLMEDFLPFDGREEPTVE